MRLIAKGLRFLRTAGARLLGEGSGEEFEEAEGEKGEGVELEGVRVCAGVSKR